MTTEPIPAIKGKLSSVVHPAKLLAGFFTAKKSGILHFRDGITELTICLKDGCVALDREAVCLSKEFGHYLVSKEVLSLGQYQRYRGASQEKNVPAVDLLIEDQVLERPTLESYVRQYYGESASGIFSWRTGEYTFFEKNIATADNPGSPMETVDIILRGIHERYDPKFIYERLRKRLDAPLKFNAESPVKPEGLQQLADLAGIIAHVKEGRTIRAVEGMPKRDRLKAPAYIFGLLTLGVLKFALSDDIKRVIAVERKSKSKHGVPGDRLSQAMFDAMKSVDRIKAAVASEPQEVEVTVAPQAGETGEEGLGNELQSRIKKLLDLKKQKRAIIEGRMKPGTRPSAPSGAAPEQEARAIQEAIDRIEKTLGRKIDAPDLAVADDETLAIQSPGPKPGVGVPLGEEEFDLAAEDQPDFESPSGADDETMFHEIDPVEQPMEGFNDYSVDEPGKVRFGPEESNENILKALRTYCDDARWPEAESAFNELVFREYDGADALALGGWARYHLAGEDPFAAGAVLVQKAIEKNQRIDLPYLIMGKIYLEEKDANMAELYFVRAIEVNRDCFEARELIKKLYQNRK